MSDQIEAAATEAVAGFIGDGEPGKIRKTIRLPAVLAATGFTRQTIWQKVRSNSFPAPVELGPNSIGWFEDEVAVWLEQRPRRTYRAEADAA